MPPKLCKLSLCSAHEDKLSEIIKTSPLSRRHVVRFMISALLVRLQSRCCRKKKRRRKKRREREERERILHFAELCEPTGWTADPRLPGFLLRGGSSSMSPSEVAFGRMFPLRASFGRECVFWFLRLYSESFSTQVGWELERQWKRFQHRKTSVLIKIYSHFLASCLFSSVRNRGKTPLLRFFRIIYKYLIHNTVILNAIISWYAVPKMLTTLFWC